MLVAVSVTWDEEIVTRKKIYKIFVGRLALLVICYLALTLDHEMNDDETDCETPYNGLAVGSR